MGLLMLGACVSDDRPNQSLNEAADLAQTALLHCFAARAVTMDDHISDATTIAQGVVGACGPQVEEYKRVFYDQKGRPGDQTRFYMMIDEFMPRVALHVVLDVRAKAQRQ